MKDKMGFAKLLLGKTWEDYVKRPTIKATIQKELDQLRSKKPLITLGQGLEEVYISEEAREAHFHVVGKTGQGKSKFLQYLMCKDIDAGNGFLLLDPSQNFTLGENVLKYALKKGREVIVIDHRHFYKYGKLPTFDPLRTGTVNALENFQILFKVKDQTETSRIQRYLSAIIQVLKKAERPITDAIYFTEFSNMYYRVQREEILSHSDELDRFRLTLEEIFGNGKTKTSRTMFNTELQSTVRRLEPIFHPVLNHIFSGQQLDFFRIIKEKVILIVNMKSYKEMERIHTNLLGISLINEISTALEILSENKWKGHYYFYLDEAGRFVNRKIEDFLSHSRQTGLRMIISHQFLDQFEEPFVRKAVLSQTDTKIFFNIEREDRDVFVKHMYGGQITDREASWVNSDLPKRVCVVKLPKRPPVRMTVPEVNDIDFKINYYELTKDYERRKDSQPSEPRTSPQHKPARKRKRTKVSDPNVSPQQVGSTETNNEGKAEAWDTALHIPSEEDKGK